MNAAARRKHARVSLVAWYGQIPVVAPLSVMAGIEAYRAGEPWAAALLIYLALISVWTGIESAHARLNADLPLEDT